jgi:demethylmenaquinone methyltransferase / 2-methoxy-6-polyprenyl-1,4-benzoquinol methylase
VPGREEVLGLFDWLAPSYDAAVVGFSLGQDLRWKSSLLSRLAPRTGETALDLACGTGLIHARLARTLGEDHVVGADLNRTMLEHGRRAHPFARFVQADAARLPFRDASFDIVTAGYLFKYVALGELLAEISRVLRKGGRFGGYDFSAPLSQTLVGRLYALYLRRGLPRIGSWTRWGRGGSADLFRFLGRVSSTSRWEDRIEGEARAVGFEDIARLPSLGGAITWVWAKKGADSR